MVLGDVIYYLLKSPINGRKEFIDVRSRFDRRLLGCLPLVYDPFDESPRPGRSVSELAAQINSNLLPRTEQRLAFKGAFNGCV